MNNNYDVCDKTSEIKYENNVLRSKTYNVFSSCIRIKHNSQDHNFFDLDSLVHEFITNHDENVEIYLVKKSIL